MAIPGADCHQDNGIHRLFARSRVVLVSFAFRVLDGAAYATRVDRCVIRAIKAGYVVIFSVFLLCGLMDGVKMGRLQAEVDNNNRLLHMTLAQLSDVEVR